MKQGHSLNFRLLCDSSCAISPSMKNPGITIIDLSPFTSAPKATQPTQEQLDTAHALITALSDLGVVYLTGHGLSRERLAEAFALSKKLFDLPYEDKMKAPHPPTAIPHRGYSGPGVEKVYSKDDRDRDAEGGGDGTDLRKVENYKVCMLPASCFLSTFTCNLQRVCFTYRCHVVKEDPCN